MKLIFSLLKIGEFEALLDCGRKPFLVPGVVLEVCNRVSIFEASLKWGIENHIFLSEIGEGF